MTTPHAAVAASPILWADSSREQSFAVWLSHIASTHALDVGSVRQASADASFRRYFRIDTIASGQAGSCIIMDAPPDKEDCHAFVKVAGLMAGAGLQAPRVLAWDEAAGFMLLSDLGAQTMMEVIAPPLAVNAVAEPLDTHHALYMQAVDALIGWQLASKPGVLPVYDDALLSRELALFPDWYVAQHRAIELTTTQRAVLNTAFEQIKASNLQSLGGAQVFVHRDYMARNLMVCDGQLGVLDFQDAVYGPITYDIASLMRDAFLSWDEDFVLDITVRYWEKARKAALLGANSPSGWGDDFGEFYRGVEWMGLQRHLKVAGIFARLTLRDGKPRYLADTPRFIGYIRATCDRYRELGPLLKLIDGIEGTAPPTGFAFGRV